MIECFISFDHPDVICVKREINRIKRALLTGEYTDKLPDEVSDAFSRLIVEAKRIDDERLANSCCVMRQYCILFIRIGMYFQLLDNREYQTSWDKLQDCLDSLRFVNRFVLNKYDLDEIGSLLVNFESLYPYKLFFSSEYLVSKSHCSICGKSMQSLSCSHRKGEIYWGEVARECVDSVKELQAVSLVEHPDDKRCVAFIADDNRSDEEKYSLLTRYLKLNIDKMCTYDKELMTLKNKRYKGIGRNDLCPCGSGRKYKKCCETTQEIVISKIRQVELVYF